MARPSVRGEGKRNDEMAKLSSVVENSYSGVFSGVEKVLFFTPEETGAESLKAPESVSGVLRVL